MLKLICNILVIENDFGIGIKKFNINSHKKLEAEFLNPFQFLKFQALKN